MKISKVNSGILVERFDASFLLKDRDWDSFIDRDDLYAQVLKEIEKLQPFENSEALLEEEILPPIGSQEVWAAGVTYYRSREARMEEAEQAGGGDFYSRVYDAERPELFYKAAAYRAAGHKQGIRIRKDSTWDVPEPELTLCVTSSGKIIGYTIGNDVSSRSIEGENPLYLPQAKTYDKSAAIGPCILIADGLNFEQTTVALEIERDNQNIFSGSTTLGRMKRKPAELVEYLFRECSFPNGCLLMTGTGIVPEAPFTLQSGDWVHITIDGIGTLSNFVE